MDYTIIHCHRVLTAVNLLFARAPEEHRGRFRTLHETRRSATNTSPSIWVGNLKDNNGHNKIKFKKKKNKRINIIIISTYTVRRIKKRERRIDIGKRNFF